jgi:4-diphosphocytidyl-2-C-methyl-D-erythritol kinase
VLRTTCGTSIRYAFLPTLTLWVERGTPAVSVEILWIRLLANEDIMSSYLSKPWESMTVYQLLAPAKINLHLEILGLRPDNFHELAMVMQSVELADLVEVRAAGDDQIILHCDVPEVPQDQTNLAYRAADLLRQRCDRSAGVEITLHKRIPMAAGLAGGSGNAAAVLVGLNLLWDLGLSVAELQSIGAELGSDVPFCISGGTAIATGRGEKITNISPLHQGAVVLGKYRSLSVSTPWAYGAYRQQFGDSYAVGEQLVAESQRIHQNELIQAIENQDIVTIGQLLYNDLEKVVLPEYPLVAQLRTAFSHSDNLGVMMSGSGPTVFALARDIAGAESIAQAVRDQVADPDLELFVTNISNQGVQLQT